MKVTFLYGPAKSGKSRYIAKKFEEEQTKYPVIIVPSGESVRYLKNLIFSDTSVVGFCGSRIITFDHLVNNITEDCAALSKTGKYFLLKNIIGRLSLKYFQPVIRFRGFYELVSRLISELKSGEIMPDSFLSGVKAKGALDKDLEIYAIYGEYQKTLHELNLYDHEGRFWQAQELIDKDGLGPFSNCRLLMLDGFRNFSPAELKIIKSCAKYIPEIIITADPFQSRPLIAKGGIENAEELHLPEQKSNLKTVTITACPGKTREIETIAKEIKNLVIHSGKKLSDIAVLFRDLSEYKELIIETFKRYGIPFSISEGLPLSKSPVIKNMLREFMSDTNMPKKADFAEYANILKKYMVNGETEAYSMFFKALDETERFCAGITGLEEFYEVLVTIADSIESPYEGNKKGQVQVLDVHRARGLIYPVVFVGGLVEKSFPKQIAEEPLYNDAERLELRNFGINVEQAKDKQEEEKFLFYSAINTANESLYLSYPATDNEGREQLVSYYIDEMKKMYTGKILEKKIRLSGVVPEFIDVYTHEELITRISYNYRNNKRDNLTMELFRHPDNSCLGRILKNTFAAGNWIITDKGILKDLKNRYGKDYRFSISQLNEYGQCPFIFFCKRVLGLEPVKEPEDEILPVDEGNLYHSILRDLYSDIENADFNEIAEKHFNSTETQGLIKNKALWQIKKEEIIKNLNDIIQYEKTEPPHMGIKRIPSYFEIAFGMEGKGDIDKSSVSEPFVIDDIKICGKIDRIDLTESGLFVVIDYKTGSKVTTTGDIKRGLNLQLPIYLLAARDVLKIGVDALEGYLFYVKRKKYYHASSLSHYKKAGKSLKPNPLWDECIKKTIEYVIDYAKNIRDGKFSPSPNRKCPSYCDYKDICRYKESEAYAENEEND